MREWRNWLTGQAHMQQPSVNSRRFVRVDGVLDGDELEHYRHLYESLLRDSDRGLRYDLGSTDGHVEDDAAKHDTDTKERITQIMWPSDQSKELSFERSALHQRLLAVAKSIIGKDAVIDFDMLIDKRTDAPTPPHQDQAYWPELSDKRAVSFWVALDDVTVETGCMWYAPGDPIACPLREHRKTLGGRGHALECDATEDEMCCAVLPAGSAVGHSGRTVHYSRGNVSGLPRRAYIVNCRPRAARDEMRAKGFDHGRKGPVMNVVNSKS